MRKAIITIILLILFTAYYSFGATVDVNIRNATKGEMLADYPFEIRLVAPDGEGQSELKKKYEVRTGKSGSFTGDLDLSAGRAIMGVINYRGVSYSSPFVRIQTGTDNYKLEISVFEITDKAESIVVTERNMAVMPKDEKNLIVYETISIENKSNSTYVGKFNDEFKMHQVLFVPLPAGYMLTGVQGTDPEGIYTLGGGVLSDNNILPGRSSIMISYYLISDIAAFDMSTALAQDNGQVDKISISFRRTDNWEIGSSNLVSAGEKSFEGSTFDTWEGRSLRFLKFRVNAPSHESGFGLWDISIIVAVALSGLGLFIFRPRIYNWQLKREEIRLAKIISQIKEDVSGSDINGYYGPFISVIEKRNREIKEKLEA